MLHLKRLIQTWTRIAAALVAATSLTLMGCGDMDRSMMGASDTASEDVVLTQPAGYLVFSQRAAVRAAKSLQANQPNGQYSYTESKWFQSGESGSLEVEFDDYGDSDDVKIRTVEFWVEKNSIDYSALSPGQVQKYVRMGNSGSSGSSGKSKKSKKGNDNGSFECEITMQVMAGKTLEEVKVAFGPSGLQFSPSAWLGLKLKGNKLDDNLKVGKGVAYHVDAAGHIETVEMEVEKKRSDYQIWILAPGFSRYSVDY